MHPAMPYLFLVRQLTQLIDTGVSIPFDDLSDHIEEVDVLDWLASRYPPKTFDISAFGDDILAEMHAALAARNDDGPDRRGPRDNGLSILVLDVLDLIEDAFKA